MSNILIETQYFPPISYFLTILKSDTLTLEACEHYQKNSYRNRCHIATSMGVHVLSVPLRKGKNSKMPIREVAIAYDVDWQKQHWQTLQTAYGSAPFWEYYCPMLKPFFTKKYPFLFDLNFEILDTFLKILKPKNSINISLSNNYEINFTKGVDFRNEISPKNEGAETRKYAQIFEDRNGFLPNLSILDLVLCAGPQAKEILV